MTWYKVGWIDLIGSDIVKQTVNSGSIKVGDIDCNQYLKLSIKVVGVFGSIVDGNINIEIYGLDAGTNNADTEPIWNQKLDSYPSSEQIVTIPNLDVSAMDSVRVIVRNNDTSYSVDVWVSYFASYFV